MVFELNDYDYTIMYNLLMQYYDLDDKSYRKNPVVSYPAIGAFGFHKLDYERLLNDKKLASVENNVIYEHLRLLHDTHLICYLPERQLFSITEDGYDSVNASFRLTWSKYWEPLFSVLAVILAFLAIDFKDVEVPFLSFEQIANMRLIVTALTLVSVTVFLLAQFSSWRVSLGPAIVLVDNYLSVFMNWLTRIMTVLMFVLGFVILVFLLVTAMATLRPTVAL